MFKNTILSKNLIEANDLAKKYNTNVVTYSGEIIYTGSYKAKLGQSNQT